LTEFNNTAPPAGTFGSYQGNIRITPAIDSEYPFGEIPIGIITADGYDSAVTLTSTYTVTTSATSVTKLNTVGSIGLYIDKDITIRAVLDNICKSCGAYWWFGDSLADNSTYNVNQVTAALFQEPSTTPDLTLNFYRVIGSSVTRSSNGVAENGLPYYSVLAHYAKNYTVQSDVLGATPAAWKATVAQDSLVQESADLNVKARHPQALRVQFESLLISQTAMQSVTDRLLSFFKKRCDIIDIEYVFNELPRVTLGMTVKLYYPRLGYENGVSFILVSSEINVQLKSMKMRLMGYKV